ncbi:MAG: hypothetical protein LBT20_04225, partial [Clostridiales bacterium]|nr:hypothetical protein [Clostridiales bacterium]
IQINDQIAQKIYRDVLAGAAIDSGTTVFDLYSGIGITSVLFAERCARVYAVELNRDAVKAAAALKRACRLSDKIVNLAGDVGAVLARLTLELDDERDEVKAVNTMKSKNIEANRARSILKNPKKVEYSTNFSFVSAPKPYRNTVFFIDPPRSGIDEKVARAVLRFNPKQIVCLSCNPLTLSDDLKRFTAEYTVKSVTPYDMFPQTSHVETLVYLDRKEEE